MRRHDPVVSLSDALRAAEAIQSFTSGRTLAEYEQDVMLSSAVERQFEIIGEALNRATQEDASLAAQLPEASHIIAFRNRLAHVYDDISAKLVWSYVVDELPGLLANVRSIISGRGGVL